ncbi:MULTISPECIES: HipA family kinase [unclassified Enterococcus]|uniref:HipA family kinase n=1 Tax=unclassified Enterococcus TaxID=2608891 RepID=UPI003D28ABDC
MSKIRKVANYLGRIPNGITQPVKVQADDGKIYIMKFIHNFCSPKILYNELIAYRLGKLLDVPMPSCSLGELSESVISKVPQLVDMKAVAGTCFLSEYKVGSVKISPMMARNTVNGQDISKILFFDQIILNNDRAKNDGNLFYDRKERKVLAIDHSHIFINGEIWTTEELENLKGRSPIVVANLLGRNYRAFSSHLRGHSCYNVTKERLGQLTKKDVQQIFQEIPEDWEMTKEEIKASFELIWEQLNQAEGIFIKLQNAYSKRKGG